MKLLKEYENFAVYDYDHDAKSFLLFLEDNFKGKYGSDSYNIFEDDGSYLPSTGKYVEFNKDNFYLTAFDMIKVWENCIF